MALLPNSKPNTPQTNVTAKPTVPANGTKPEAKPEVKSEAKPEVQTLSLNDIESGAFMLPAELSDTAAPVRARNEKQQAMDKKVKELHAAWLRAGKPNTWANMVAGKTVATYFTEPDKSAELHKLINRAVALHGVRARMGTSFRVTEKHVAAYGLPAHYLGREAISFAVMDKRPRATSDGKPAAEVKDNPSNAKK